MEAESFIVAIMRDMGGGGGGGDLLKQRRANAPPTPRQLQGTDNSNPLCNNLMPLIILDAART